jgi:dihydrofolate reductase
MGLLTFSINVTLDGCVDHEEGIADDETHAFFTLLMDERGAMPWGRVTYEMMESYWPAVARADVEAPPAIREWAVKLEAKPKYVVSSTRTDFPWANSHHIADDLRTGIQRLKDATPAGVLLGSGKLATELDRLDLIDEYQLLVHPRIAELVVRTGYIADRCSGTSLTLWGPFGLGRVGWFGGKRLSWICVVSSVFWRRSACL